MVWTSAVLLALSIALAQAVPRNHVAVEGQESSGLKVMGATRAQAVINSFQNDQSSVRLCTEQKGCEITDVRSAKQYDYGSLLSVSALKGETELTRAIAPTLNTMSDSLKRLQEQKKLLEQLEKQMNDLTSASQKGQMLSESTKGQMSATILRGIQMPTSAFKGAQAAPLPTKGVAAAPMMKGSELRSAFTKGVAAAPMTKGLAAAPMGKGLARAPSSKGASIASTMALEAAMCPMTMYELGKCQKTSGETKMQLDASNSLNAQLMAEKQRLEAALAASENLRAKAQQQADFNAKYAADMKNKADMFSNALTMANAEKELLKSQKGQLELTLGVTQQALAMEKAKNNELNASLTNCLAEKAALQQALQIQTERAEKAEAELASTRAKLEEETNARIVCEESLAFTQSRLARSEADLAKERETREQTEEELMKTMTELASVQKEARVTAEILSRTQDELQEKTAALAREEAARETLQAKLDATVEELRNTQQELRDTQRALEDEQNAHGKTQRQLQETQEELAATEAARKELEEAKQQLENELVETKNQLQAMTDERDMLQTTLDSTSAALAQTSAEKMQCESSLATQNAVTKELTENLNNALMMLKMEKDAREELASTISMVQTTSMKVQEEVKKLQTENAFLQAQVQKLKSEQEVALALAAGCPPTYEKFGSSCYKYVREKTQWKMAQEQCMKDKGNLVALEGADEQLFITNYLKRHGASDPYAWTSGNKQFNGWKWLGASNNHMGASGVEFWYNAVTKSKPSYDCQAMYLYDTLQYGKWVGLPCYTAAPYVCEVNLLPPGTMQVGNAVEKMALGEMSMEAPPYLRSVGRY